jgi:hypothetical protein
MSESSFGGDTGFEEEETSVSSDVRAGYDEDKPPERAAEETNPDERDSYDADVAAAYGDENPEDDDDTVG